jgi:hypothetical protein
VSERSHHYLDGVKLRVQTLVTWCEAISRMCEEVDPQQHDQPAPFAVTYCGYAEQVDRRKKQYEKKQSTTWFVLLVEATFKAIFPDRGIYLPVFMVVKLRSLSKFSSKGGGNVDGVGETAISRHVLRGPLFPSFLQQAPCLLRRRLWVLFHHSPCWLFSLLQTVDFQVFVNKTERCRPSQNFSTML